MNNDQKLQLTLDELTSKTGYCYQFGIIRNFITVDYYNDYYNDIIEIDCLNVKLAASITQNIRNITIKECSNVLYAMLNDLHSKLMTLTNKDFIKLKQDRMLDVYVDYYNNLPSILRNNAMSFYIRILYEPVKLKTSYLYL